MARKLNVLQAVAVVLAVLSAVWVFEAVMMVSFHRSLCKAQNVPMNPSLGHAGAVVMGAALPGAVGLVWLASRPQRTAAKAALVLTAAVVWFSLLTVGREMMRSGFPIQQVLAKVQQNRAATLPAATAPAQVRP
ncbi:MAG: hypothetical protein BWX88_04578 [Planctomycetes bacterium ADurb.Bin126]|nr:MAG: hypothetical protein BWX88_04578 [Planctomycetes bacterium ADurb.Bin126]HQL75181.1 hypothetical protein [Phycisphaerae bacterium]